MSSSFKLCPTHFPGGGENFCRGRSHPGYGPITTRCLFIKICLRPTE